MKTIRQGDLLFVPIESIPETTKKRESGIIAKGEATGHHHRIAVLEDAEVLTATSTNWRETEEQVFLNVTDRGISIVHEEHGPVTLEPGTYKVHKAREFDYVAQFSRPVYD